MAESVKNLAFVFKEHLAADKKKSAILAILLGILLIALARLLMGGSTPQTLKAVPIAVPPAQPTPPTAQTRIRPIPQPLQPSPVATTTAADSRRSAPTNRPAGRESKGLSTKGLSRELARDLFSTPGWNEFPQAALLDGDREDELRRREEILDRIRAELDELELQSTMTGTVKTAYISGHLVSEGGTFRGFSVLRIGERHVLLRKSGITQTLSMP